MYDLDAHVQALRDNLTALSSLDRINRIREELMPENPSCVYCGRPVDILGGTEEYLITNKDQGVPKDQWAYTHLECHTDHPGDHRR